MLRSIFIFTAILAALCASPTYAQTSGDSKAQKDNVRQLGDVLTPLANSPTRRSSQTTTPQILSTTHQIALSKAPASQLAMMQLHFNQEEWFTPSLSDRTPDPFIAIATSGEHPPLNQVLLWNHAALDLTSLDFTSVPNPQIHPEFAEQLGPPCTSRALAIVHMAMFEALNAVEQKYSSYQAAGMTSPVQQAALASINLTPGQVTITNTDENSAVEYAAYTALANLYSHKADYLSQKWLAPDDAVLLTLPDNVPGNPLKARIAQGQAIGIAIAEQILLQRAADGSQMPTGVCVIGANVSNLPTSGPGYPSNSQYLWVADPIHPAVQTALGSSWGNLPPFVLTSGSQFRPAKPDPTTSKFADDFKQVLALGAANSTSRTAAQKMIGIFWAYDGTPGLCAPPRLYNMIARSIATDEKPVTDPLEMARLFALVNVSMADAGIAAWDGKYYFRFARPVSAIRQAVVGGRQPYASWLPLGAQVTNTATVNFTPPFPSYPSGHATFGGAFFASLRHFWSVPGNDANTAFTFTSDEFNGFNRDPVTGQTRPAMPVHFDSFRDAEDQNSISRVYLGIHWKTDADAGDAEGKLVGDYVANNLYTHP